MRIITNGIAGYKKIFCYEGVTSRQEYIDFILFEICVMFIGILIAFLFSVLLGLITGASISSMKSAIVTFLLIGVIISTLTKLSINCRRLHDMGLSGWMQLVPILLGIGVGFFVTGFSAIIQLLFFIFLLSKKTKDTCNAYRPARKYCRGN